MYRFSSPTRPGYPHQIELLSRRPEHLEGVEAVVGKIPVDESKYSLSAILLNHDYYELLASGTAVTRKYGVPTLKHEYLPVFKIRAFNDLTERRNRGEDIRSSEIGKHRRDIFRLVSMLPGRTRVDLSKPIKKDVIRFLELVSLPSRNYMKSIGLGNVTLDDLTAAIRSIYLI